MGTTFYTLQLPWTPIQGLDEAKALAVSHRVESVCASWEGTPYMSGQIAKGVGCYCAALPVAILDELFGIEKSIPKLTFLRSAQTKKTARFMLERYKDLADVIEIPHPAEQGIEPGDVLVLGSPSPVHILIVGGFTPRLWHATSPIGACLTGLGFYDPLARVYRVTNKHLWLPSSN